MKNSEIYSCDFETTTDSEDCRVWAWGASNIFNIEEKYFNNSIESFITFMSEKSRKYYFHNLSFDGEFIIHYLLKNGFEYSEKPKEYSFKTIISNLGQWYSIEIWFSRKKKKYVKATIWDSLKLIPFSVSQIAKDFKLPIRKLKLDYNAYREVGHKLTEHEKDYLFNDIDIVALALKELYDEGFSRMTATSCAFYNFKQSLPVKFEKLFPVFSLELDRFFRDGYYGGFVWSNPLFQEKEIGKGIVFDVNSLYPSRMVFEDLPYGLPEEFYGEPKNDSLWVSKISFCFDLKDDHIPCITLDKFSMYMTDKKYIESSEGESVTMVLTSVDWELFNEQYDIYDVHFFEGYYLKSCVGLAEEFINQNMEIKKKNKGAKRFIAKRNMNSCYGKFAKNPDMTEKIPFIDEEGILRLKNPTIFEYENGQYVEKIDVKMDKPIYIPYAMFVTAYARKYTISTAQKVGLDRVAYIDTDSIHLVGTEIPKPIENIIDDKELGFWGLESIYDRSYFIGSKSYVEEIQISYKEYVEAQKEFIEDNNKKDNLYYIRNGICYFLNVKCAGMTQKAKQNVTYENFRVGNVVDDCLKKTHVKNGIVLVDRKFKIKRR